VVSPAWVVVVALVGGERRWSRSRNLAVPDITWKVSSSLRWMWKGGQRELLGLFASEGGAGAGGRWFSTR